MSSIKKFEELLKSGLSVKDMFSATPVELRDEFCFLHLKAIGRESADDLYNDAYPKKKKTKTSSSSSSSSKSGSKKKGGRGRRSKKTKRRRRR
tara:strand:+ start:420 stop:698 length:279 start_codon:yes stop_codon:yes gene_type:complete